MEEEKQPDADGNDDKKAVEEPLNQEKPPGPKKKILSAKLTVSLFLIAGAFSGFFVFDYKSKPLAMKGEESKVSDTARVPLKDQQKNETARQGGSGSGLEVKIREIDALRDALLHKQEEILELKDDYQKGIDELEKELADEMHKEGIRTFLQAMENRRIEFGLHTIQRRQIYIRKLERPLNWIFESGEELLYIKRQAMVDLQVAEIASGIDLSRHAQQMDAAAEKYRLTADRLAIDATPAQPESLETIWERIDRNRLKNAAQPHSKNQVIAEQVCKGEFEHLSELTEIVTDTAKCVVRMQGSGLLLSGLTELTPAAARHLFQWKGSWICLNGLRVLSPRAAHYLFQWQGCWISLNGLTEFPAEIGEALLQWNGTQLELMGLRYIEDAPEKIGVEFLAQWERYGGKLFAELRDEIKAEQNRFEINSFHQALQNLRIRYNLSLIQVIRAYTNRLDARIDYFQTGNERLRFMVYEINDDIAVINTLVDMEIENLMNRIDGLLNQYIPETKKQIIDAADILPVPVERIWNEINLHSAAVVVMPATQPDFN